MSRDVEQLYWDNVRLQSQVADLEEKARYFSDKVLELSARIDRLESIVEQQRCQIIQFGRQY